MSDSYAADLLRRLHEAEACTDAARDAYLAAMAAEAEARAPIKDTPAVLPGSARQDGALGQPRRGGWGVSNDPDVLVAELKTLIARTEERYDHAAIYRTSWASQVEKDESTDRTN
jgi:hypothetical protein